MQIISFALGPALDLTVVQQWLDDHPLITIISTEMLDTNLIIIYK
jgi:hypothetical protein